MSKIILGAFSILFSYLLFWGTFYIPVYINPKEGVEILKEFCSFWPYLLFFYFKISNQIKSATIFYELITTKNL